jgi:hypothetical protein
MSSSSTDDRTHFLSADRGSLVRLAVVLLFGAAALVGPLVSSTSARFTDAKQIEVTFSVPATPTDDPTPGPTP